jgi:HlyD family secretion protein
MRRIGKVRLLLIAVVILLPAGLWVAQAMTEGTDIRWTGVERDDLILGVEVNGSLQSTETSVLGPPQLRDVWNYKIANMHPEGEEVKAGTPVLAFDDRDLHNRLNRQRAEAAEAQKKIEKLEINLELSRRSDEMQMAEADADLRRARLIVDRPPELAKAQDLASGQLDLELAEKKSKYLVERLKNSVRSAAAQLGALKAQEQRATTRVAEIEAAISDMVRLAPRDGTVIYVTNRGDEKSKVGDQVWRGASVIELPDLTTMKAAGRVAEADAGQLRDGQRVDFRLDAHPDLKVSGRIQSIWKTVQRESWNSPLKIARLEIELDETDTRRMRPGMRFRGRIETERVDDVLLIPLEAVFVTPEGATVYRKTLFGTEQVSVQLGRRNETRVEVVAGLKGDDRVSLTDLSEANR